MWARSVSVNINAIIRKIKHWIVLDNRLNMTTFVSRTSPVTGKVEWIPQDENYDYIQEIARSAYGDMLHDTERNRLYYEGVRRAVREIHGRGQAARVLDIGTGTGLLAMMAASCGADTITACEAFSPMAACARQVIEDNKLSSKIRLVDKRSTDMHVGPDADLEERANILVTEVFDTELIGEGAIGTFHHAHKCLLTKDCIVVPSAANMYVQLVESPFVRRWYQLQPITVSADVQLNIPPTVRNCPGAAAVHDVQMSELHDDQFRAISKPKRIFRFDYSGRSEIEMSGNSQTDVIPDKNGDVDAVFMWWDLEMDTAGDVILSCAPRWAHPSPHNMQWRDHWMQAIYSPTNPVKATTADTLRIHSYHDDYSLWFHVEQLNGVSSTEYHKGPPVCKCGAHMTCSRTQLGRMNDLVRQNKYNAIIAKHVKPHHVCLSVGDACLLPLMAAKLGAKHVYAVEQHSRSAALLEQLAEYNGLTNLTVLHARPEDITEKMLNDHKVDMLLAEPFFSISWLPWHDLYFWYTRTEINHLLVDKPIVIPGNATLRAIGVEFSDLWKIRADVGNCEGFDLSHFDRMIEKASLTADASLEPQPLWEYPAIARTDVFPLMTFDLSRPLHGIKTIERTGMLEINSSGWVSGVVVWLDIHVDGNQFISRGPVEPVKPGKAICWDPHSKQAIHLFRRPCKVNTHDHNKKWRLKYKIHFRPSSGDFEFDFDVVNNVKA